MVHWARVTSRRGGCELGSLDDLEVEVMTIASVLGVKMEERAKVLRVARFECGEPMR